MCWPTRNLCAPLVLALTMLTGPAFGQDAFQPPLQADLQPVPAATGQSAGADVQQLRQALRQLQQRVDRQDAFIRQLQSPPGAGPQAGGSPPERLIPVSPERNQAVQPAYFQVQERPESTYQTNPLFPEKSPALPPSTTVSTQPFEAGYDRGFYIRPTRDFREQIPFDMKINGRLDMRHIGLKSDNPNLTSRNDFELERARLRFQGNALAPNLGYELQLRFGTDTTGASGGNGGNVQLFDFYFDYEFSKAFIVLIGQTKVAFGRSWLQSSSRLQLADRSMATTFFNPNRSQGIWFRGEPLEHLYYDISVTNGFNGTSLTPTDFDRNFGYAGTVFWDPLESYSPGFSDLAYHEDLAIRLGTSFKYMNVDFRSSGREAGQFRVNDTGQRITAAFPGNNGAIAGFQNYAYAADFGAKYRGFSFFGETYFRWLQGFKGSAVPVNKLFDWGYVAQGGYFLIPERFEVFVRGSRVIGAGGAPSADEYAGGLNWFWKGHNLKLTFDATKVNGSPAVSSSPNFRAGEDGLLFRTQVQAAF